MHKKVLFAVVTALIEISSAQSATTTTTISAIVNATTVTTSTTFNATTSSTPPPRCGKAFQGLRCPTVPGNCQEKYGWCDSMRSPTGASVYEDQPTYDDSFPMVVDRCTKQRTLALSFDDGPSNYTNDVLDVLRAHNATATFFLGGILNGRGQLDVDWVPVVRRMITDGHQIGSHTWSHPNLDLLSSEQRADEMHKNERAIANIIGKIPTFMRPPMSQCNTDCEEDMRALGYHVVQWEYDSRDSEDPLPSMEAMTDDNLMAAMDRTDVNGSMFIIQHDIHGNAARVADSLLTNMHANRTGWEAVPVVECIGLGPDDAYRFPKYLEYNGAAQGGCLVSGPNMCVQPIIFKSWDGCLDAREILDRDWRQCVTREGPTTAHCVQAQKLAADMDRFCNECDEEGMPACDSDAFKSVRY
ncbi:hypothetical protein LTR70_000563 [Exophiala xenobiotica]|uniref:NodB homology domain-containing protein n=1 Tax=Lithohypha guttulata TaxID=1690604 RepID=A0ABR0KKW1_9EURO|nr:hypothetical protein LTR24_002189 [Lithohypha guttulata]KAK5329414.1 hypothetical protein LTR70_000563 [Exophiala xenobiotica]